MAYIRETCAAGKTFEVRKYYSYRCPRKGGRRERKERPTCEAQARVNRRKAARELRRLMNANFQDGDLLVRLDFCKTDLPEDSSRMQEYMGTFLKKLRVVYRKLGTVLKYIYVKEVGPRGGRHVHILLSRCADALEVLRRCWTFGGIHADPLNSGGQYKRIAEYFIKYSGRTQETEGQLIGKRWYPSRSLVRPVVHREQIRARSFRRNIKTLPGYVLEKDSVQYGISEYSGYEYFSYTLIKTGDDGGGKQASDRTPEAAEESCTGATERKRRQKNHHLPGRTETEKSETVKDSLQKGEKHHV
ncbi:MAG: hypothetical protein K2N94_05390 [Lachnospiraceae bacterium]|nr:hypothetical protein [Lachnospiraceae bacterium]